VCCIQAGIEVDDDEDMKRPREGAPEDEEGNAQEDENIVSGDVVS